MQNRNIPLGNLDGRNTLQVSFRGCSTGEQISILEKKGQEETLIIAPYAAYSAINQYLLLHCLEFFSDFLQQNHFTVNSLPVIQGSVSYAFYFVFPKLYSCQVNETESFVI